MGGRRVQVRRPRARTLDGQEVQLPSWTKFGAEDPLNERAVEQMLIGVTTRRYARSLELLRRVKESGARIKTKSGIMLGLGEQEDEVLTTLRDLVAHGCDLLTIGQYLRPSPNHLPVIEYVHPDRFRWWGERAESLGFESVASGPLVRSSFHADELAGTVHPGESSKAG